MWFVHYYLGFVPSSRSPVGTAQLGTRFHTGMEGLYGYGLDPLLVLKLLYAAEIAEHPEFEDELRKEHDLASAMTEGYMEWAVSEGIDADWRVMGTEQDLRVDLPGVPGVQLRGRLDQFTQQVSTGFLYFLDWKTSDSFEQHGVLELSPQFKTYSVMLHLHHGVPFTGPVPEGVPVVNGGVIRTARRCKRTERSKPPYFMHDPFRYNPEQLHAALGRCQQVCTEIMNARQALDWCYAEQGGRGALATLNQVQRTVCRPVPILRDCSWRCELSSGLCTSLDDGADWPGMLERSGRWKREDPYSYYERDGLASIRAQLAAL
jgi:hypothetical protein